MDNTFNHILSESGVLKTFNISKKVSSKEIDTFIKKHKEECATKFELQEMIKEELFEHTKDYLTGHHIPGLIIPPGHKAKIVPKTNESGPSEFLEKKTYRIKDKRFIKVRENANALNEMLRKKGLSKNEMLFFVISLVEFLELKDEDFEEFHRRLDDENGPMEEDDD